MNWSSYQLAIFEFIKNEAENGFVNAVAGSGKTKVIEEANRRIPPMAKDFRPITKINTCFNVHIMEALKKKGLEAGTLNSLGWGTYLRNYDKPKFDKMKNEHYLYKQLKNNEDDMKKFFRIKNTVHRVVSLFKHLGLQHYPEDWVILCDEYGIETGGFKEEDEIDYWCQRVFNYSINELNVADFDDQIYQVNRQQWPVQKRDICFIDEAQDFSQTKIDFALQLGKRIIAVGDPHQAIYVFAGASINAVDNIIEKTNAVSLPLSVCYRCCRAVIELAQTYVPHIEAYSEANQGLVDDVQLERFFEEVRENDYVLCRTTAPLVQKCLEAIRMKRKAFVRGRDLGTALTSVIDKGKELCHSNVINHFIVALEDYKNERTEHLRATNRQMEALSLEDRIDTIIALASDCDFVDEIPKLIDTIFSDESKDGIEFSTIHKAKGNEKERVFCLRPDLLPHPKAPSHLLKIEDNLAYVQITRAKNELYFVRGK